MRCQVVASTRDDKDYWYTWVSLGNTLRLTNWLPFHWQHFEIHFLKKKVLYFYSNPLKVVPDCSVHQKLAMVEVMVWHQTMVTSITWTIVDLQMPDTIWSHNELTWLLTCFSMNVHICCLRSLQQPLSFSSSNVVHCFVSSLLLALINCSLKHELDSIITIAQGDCSLAWFHSQFVAWCSNPLQT